MAPQIHRAPAEDVALAADLMICSATDDHDRALAGLLNYIADTWAKQDAPVREHAHYVATTWHTHREAAR